MVAENHEAVVIAMRLSAWYMLKSVDFWGCWKRARGPCFVPRMIASVIIAIVQFATSLRISLTTLAYIYRLKILHKSTPLIRLTLAPTTRNVYKLIRTLVGESFNETTCRRCTDKMHWLDGHRHKAVPSIHCWCRLCWKLWRWSM